ncbi:hypothetical protein [Candidatus Similichlamydia epinepheli]|uniref:hypothetical protein n=1 Tax=Candidatus Similichlamydia epinepheli TaxID=1903953 RepID=UPI000D3A0DA0|nr:hypothetical protein [Candidatus Similichlamydia epinepheli]
MFSTDFDEWIDVSFIPSLSFGIATSSRLLNSCSLIQEVAMRRIACVFGAMSSVCFVGFSLSHFFLFEPDSDSYFIDLSRCFGLVFVAYLFLSILRFVFTYLLFSVTNVYLFIYCICSLIIILGDLLKIPPFCCLFQDENALKKSFHLICILMSLTSFEVWL